MKLMHASIPEKKTGMALLAVLAAVLLGLTFFSVGPSASSVEAASAIAQKTQGCSGSWTPPTLQQALAPFDSFNLQGWTVDSFNVSTFSQTSTSVQVSNLNFVGTYYSPYTYPSWSASDNKTTMVTVVYEGSAAVHLGSLFISRNTTTLTVSIAGLTGRVGAENNASGTWQKSSLVLSNNDFQLSWSCTQQ